jgi:ribonuclease VapC
MVIDSSALVAIAFDEPEGARFQELILESKIRLVSAISRLECSIVVRARKGAGAAQNLEALFRTMQIAVIDFTATDAAAAFEAWTRFGKGNHPAGLNLGDCCTYALCKSSGEPVLCKGVDFGRTDLKIATG